MQLDLLQKEALSLLKAAEAAIPKNVRPVPVAKEFSEKLEEKAPGAFKTISEAAAILDVPQHVLRFWEGRFSQIKPLKLHGGRRYYRPEDMEILSTIKHLLYQQGYTIKGARKAFSARKRPASGPQAEPARPSAAAAKSMLADRQKNQLAVIRQELIGLREALKPYI